MTTLKKFLGINNVADPVRGTVAKGKTPALSWEWLRDAINVDLDNEHGVLLRKAAVEEAKRRVTGSFDSPSLDYALLVSDGELFGLREDASMDALCAGCPEEAWFCLVNGEVYVSGDGFKKIVGSEGVRDWGVATPSDTALGFSTGGSVVPDGEYRFFVTHENTAGEESGATGPYSHTLAGQGLSITAEVPANMSLCVYATSANGTVPRLIRRCVASETFTFTPSESGRILRTLGLSGVRPQGRQLTFFKGRVVVGEYFVEDDQSALWMSEPLGYGLFNYEAGFLLLSGKLCGFTTFLRGAEEVLIIAMTDAVFTYDGERLSQVLDYGGVYGNAGFRDAEGVGFLWTQRGLVAFQRDGGVTNLNDGVFSPLAAARGEGSYVEDGGYEKFVVKLGGATTSFNER